MAQSGTALALRASFLWISGFKSQSRRFFSICVEKVINQNNIDIFMKLRYIILFLLLASFVFAENDVTIHIFHAEGNAPSEQAISFFETEISNLTGVFLAKKDVYANPEYSILVQDYAKLINRDFTGLPTIFIDDKMYAGFHEGIGKDVMKDVYRCQNYTCFDLKELYDRDLLRKQKEAELLNASKYDDEPEDVVDVIFSEPEPIQEEASNENEIVDDLFSEGPRRIETEEELFEIEEETNFETDEIIVNKTPENKTYTEELFEYLLTQDSGRFDILLWIGIFAIFIVAFYFTSRIIYRKRFKKTSSKKKVKI
jgi:hypothetical protein